MDTWPDDWVVDADTGGVLCTSQDWSLKTPVWLSLLFLLRPRGDDGTWWKELVLLNPCVQSLLPNTGTGILLTLEYGFELCKSIYTWILSNKHIVSPLYSWVLHCGFNQLQIENSIFWRCRRLTICIFCAILYKELEHLWLLVSAERGGIWNQSRWKMTVVKFLGSQTLYVYFQLHRVLAHPTPALVKGHLYHHTSKK